MKKVDNFHRRVDFILAVFSCLLWIPAGLHAQSGAEDYLVVERLTRENGLPDQDINGIYFDTRGYAWISTFGGGLVRYDGDSFIKFSQKTDPPSVGDIVSRCAEDDYGRLWIPEAGRMDLLDLKTLTLTEDLPDTYRKWLRVHPSGALNRDAKGSIWFTSKDHLFRVAFEDDGKSFLIDSLKCNVSNDNLLPHPYDVEKDGSVWISLGGRFYKVRPIEGKGLRMSAILPGLDIGDDNAATTFLRTGNDVWIGTLKGLYRVDLATGHSVFHRHSGTDARTLPNDEITALCATPEGEIAIGTVGGLCIYNPADHSFDTYGSRMDDEGHQLPGEIVRSIAAKGRQIWVGLEGEGLVILQRKTLRITHLSHIETTTTTLPSTPIRSLFIDDDDVLWLATTEFGLCRQVGDRVFRNYNTTNSPLPDNSLTAFCEDGQGRLWFGTVDGHLGYVDKNRPDVIHLPNGHLSDLARNIDVVLGLTYDRVNDFIWIMARSGLYIYDLNRSCFTEYSVELPTCLTACIMADHLWVSTTGGMRIINLGTLESRKWATFPACMSLVAEGNVLWAGTYGNGLYRVDDCLAEEPDITVYSEKDGLADNQINGLLLDGIHLWITTEYGLSRLDTQTGELASYGTKDGLRSMAFCENSIAKGRDGTIYIGSKGGHLYLLRSGYVPNESGNKPDVVISGYWSKDKFHSLSHSDTVVKDEKDTDFTLKFSDLSFSKGNDVIYESRIWPTERNWSPVFENDTYMKFAHIPGGKYRIQIRAVDKEGNVLSQDEKTLDVTPVVYNRWWFRLLSSLFIAFIIYLLVLRYTKNIKSKKDLLQEEVDRQTKELKEQKEELERKAEALAEQNALLQRQNEMIASHNTLMSGTPSDRDSEFNAALLEVIQKMYKDPELDVQTLSEAMGMSRSQLNEKIQKTLGLSIAQFIRTYRLNVAKEMICNGTNTGMNISEIAYEVGFNDPKYFTRCFTREFNATPSDLHRKGKAS